MTARKRIGVLALAGCLAALGPAGAAATGLDAYAWKNRLVLSFAPDANAPEAERQRAIRAEEVQGWQERDLVLIEIFPNTVMADRTPAPHLDAEALRTLFGVPEDAYAAILIGKDTGEKDRSSAAFSNNALFATIDVMPMRRREMRE